MGGLGRIVGVVALLAGAAAAAEAPAGVVAERRAGEHRAGEIMRDLRAEILAGRAVAPLAGQAQSVAEWVGRLPDLFPPGSDTGETNALSQVWRNRPGFERLALAAAGQARRLVAAAQAGDPAEFAAAYRAVADACGACHRQFRRR